MPTLVPTKTAARKMTTGARRIHTLKPRTYHFRRGDQLPEYGELIWYIAAGHVRTTTWSQEGEVTTLGIWGEGDCIGKSLSIVSPYHMECLSDVTATLYAQPVERLSEKLLFHFQQTEKLLAISHQRQVSDRLLHLLTWLADRFGQNTPDGQLLEIGLTHQQLAELAGTTRVTVTRFMNQLEASGKIRRLPRRCVLISPAIEPAH